jgi:hypothetical protein
MGARYHPKSRCYINATLSHPMLPLRHGLRLRPHQRHAPLALVPRPRPGHTHAWMADEGLEYYSNFRFPRSMSPDRPGKIFGVGRRAGIQIRVGRRAGIQICPRGRAGIQIRVGRRAGIQIYPRGRARIGIPLWDADLICRR